jgi:putative ABC transport system permease protein
VGASWQRIGADVRVEGTLTDQQLSALRSSPGVSAMSAQLVIPNAHVSSGVASALITLVGVDADFEEVLAQRPPSSRIVGAERISALTAKVKEDEPLPVLATPRLARQLGTDPVNLVVDGLNRGEVDAVVVGTLDAGADGFETAPFIYIDRQSLIDRVGLEAHVNTVFIDGPGAKAAAAHLDGDVFSRASWLADRHQRALVAGVRDLMLASTGSVALLALIALIASVLASSRRRGRTLALLRTLGLNRRLGWWLALSELGPVVLASVVVGGIAGVLAVLVLAPSFGLESLTGGIAAPDLSLSPVVLLAVAAAAVVVASLATLVEVVVHRRDKLSSVLRVGEQ